MIGKLLKKSSTNQKLKLVTAVSKYMAFKHSISFATNLAAKFGCYQIRIMPDIISKPLFYSIWSHCAVPLNLSRHPFLGQVVVFRSALCTKFNLELAVVFLCYISTPRSMNDRKTERSNGHCFGQQRLLANSIKNFKKLTPCCPKLQIINLVDSQTESVSWEW